MSDFSHPEQAGEWMCPNCGDTVDLQEPSKEWDCSYCGETMEPRKKTDATPNDELRELIERWRDYEYTQKVDYYADIGMQVAADELEELIDDE